MLQTLRADALSDSQLTSSPRAESNRLRLEPPSQGVAEALLGSDIKRPPFILIAAGAVLYLAGLYAAVTIDFSPPPVTLEAPVEMVYEEPQAPEETKQPEQTTPPAEKQPEPEPVKEAEAVEPVKPPEPVKEEVKEQKPQEQPKPEQKPKPRPAAKQHIDGAVASNFVNLVYQRINRVASGNVPRGIPREGARVSYTIVIGRSGELISKRVRPSGAPALDQAVLETLSRSAPFPTIPASLPGSSFAISGAIAFRVQ